ncbi:MAG: hypothetical protein UT82_C0033G0002 [Parcubacteria group bacterium GW2011_GWB1_40_14]|nr:MAG: hypothetical protein UT82_C0033G0002 [Parcubacteria group bacterium GW2011_GWB1_40_14]
MNSIAGIFIVLAILILSIILHEIAHGVAALFFGDDTAKRAGRLTLNPLPHIDLLGSIFMPLIGLLLGGFIIAWAKPVPFNPANFKRNPRLGLFSVAIGGVATNFILAVVAALVAKIFLSFGQAELAQLMVPVVLLNIFLGIFNLIPIPPLDGSKVLYAIFNLSNLQQHQIEMKIGGFTGFFIIIMLMMFGVLAPVFNFARLAAQWLLLV